MMTLISQMIGCLLIAAGIGFGVGWWLRQIPKRSQEQPSHDATGLLRTKEQALDALTHDLKVKTSAVQILEQKVMSSETMHSSVQRELIARNERLKALEAELTTRSKQLTISEGEGATARRRVSEIESILATQTHELRGAQQTCRNAEQAREIMEREVGVLREHIAQLNEGLADRERLRTQIKQLETAQDRVHQLEVELSDREAAHRGIIQQLERALTERDQRIEAFDSQASTQAEDLRAARQISQSAEQAREVMEREVSALRDHIAQLNEGLADRERLRSQVKQLETAQDRIHQLEVELSDREAAHRTTIQQLERTLAERDQRIGEADANAAAHMDELRDAQQASQSAEQAREVLKEEIRVLRDHIAQLNEGLADRERLRSQVKQLETAQDRIHQLEVELSDREAAHRTTIQQLEQSLVDRDRRIEELVPMPHLLREKEAVIKEWERTHAQTVKTLERETATLLEQNLVYKDLQAQHQLEEQRVQERDKQLADLQRELQELHTERDTLRKEVQGIPEKDEQIERLQKRLKELRATLRTTPPAPITASAPQSRQHDAETPPLSSPPKGSKPKQSDDLKKIQGIGPVFAETLHKLGTRTFIQIARWKPEDVEKIAKKLATDPERIKRENWIAGAKKQHYDKYKERL
ncbi:hypothetical protein COMA1_70007 [Candidatus Nitrospira nitrosa]|uniref:Uncharacterized protein n=1 Tax=Candidatus Nitrospira nitrosa TaxID=1742972 RepID=A0A0S4LNA2_9BACT|nr:hypothetical protein [Candidatus Nitrospira nitrosa]CUS39063.1 hypothetical protein COMA1_70007 [Candidatus Nitrospira nitrosa]